MLIAQMAQIFLGDVTTNDANGHWRFRAYYARAPFRWISWCGHLVKSQPPWSKGIHLSKKSFLKAGFFMNRAHDPAEWVQRAEEDYQLALLP